MLVLYPVILAGGSGTRLWPLSRKSLPKQFLAIASERSLLQDTISRLDGIRDAAAPIFVCNEEHRFLTAEHIRLIGKTSSAIIVEPKGRNTGPALTLAALNLMEEYQNARCDDPVMLVMPSDHVIKDVDKFHLAVQRGVALAETGCAVAIGVVPVSPNTGYGYIRKGDELDRREGGGVTETTRWSENPSSKDAIFHVAAFVEKPEKTVAQEMFESGEYLWNSGIFMVQASVWLEQLRRYRPDIAEICAEAYTQGKKDGEFYKPDPSVFASCPGDFVAYSIMEKMSEGTEAKEPGKKTTARSVGCVVIPLDAGWSDVGEWSSLWDDGEKDVDGNVIKGAVDAVSMRDSLLIGQHGRIFARGLENVIVVETEDVVLVSHKDYAQNVKDVVNQIESDGRREIDEARKTIRPWGSYVTMDSGPHSRVRVLSLNPGAALSSHKHLYRAEHWIILKGIAKILRNDQELILEENQSTDMPVGTWHRLENPGDTPLELIEVQSGGHIDEDDIILAERHH